MALYFLNKPKIFLISFILVLIDQTTKLLILKLLSEKNLITILPNILNLNLVTNYGAAFNILNNSTVLLKYISLIASILFAILILASQSKTHLEKLSLAFLLAGSIGNGIDRWIYGYVIDFINVSAINFPVFNFADIYINLAVVLLILDILNKNINKQNQLFKTFVQKLNK